MPEQALQSLPPWYTITAAAGICLSLAAWVFMIRRGVGGHRTDPRLPLIYGCALLGAIIGAKLSFLLAEAWNQPFSFEMLLSGKSITGALLVGYIAVEWAKRYLEYQSTTGDLFAWAVPIGVGVGGPVAEDEAGRGNTQRVRRETIGPPDAPLPRSSVGCVNNSADDEQATNDDGDGLPW
jgi:hypothetical protein